MALGRKFGPRPRVTRPTLPQLVFSIIRTDLVKPTYKKHEKKLYVLGIPYLLSCLKFGPENFCPKACLDSEPENLSLNLVFIDKLPRPDKFNIKKHLPFILPQKGHKNGSASCHLFSSKFLWQNERLRLNIVTDVENWNGRERVNIWNRVEDPLLPESPFFFATTISPCAPLFERFNFFQTLFQIFERLPHVVIWIMEILTCSGNVVVRLNIEGKK